MNGMLLARFESDHFIMIHNLTITEFSGAVMNKHSLDSPDQLTIVIENHFTIPETKVQENLPELKMLNDALSRN
jgi:hypothetical protein